MSLRWTTVTRSVLQCPHCDRNLGYADEPVGGGPHKIGEPFWRCNACAIDFVIPPHFPARCDEWEMKPLDQRERALTKAEQAVYSTLSNSLSLGLCAGSLLGVLVFVASLTVIAWQGAATAGLVAAVATLVAIIHSGKRSALRARLAEVENLLGSIEASRNRLASRAYRDRLRQLGLPVREGSEEPPYAQAAVDRLKARLAVLWGGKARIGPVMRRYVVRRGWAPWCAGWKRTLLGGAALLACAAVYYQLGRSPLPFPEVLVLPVLAVLTLSGLRELVFGWGYPYLIEMTSGGIRYVPSLVPTTGLRLAHDESSWRYSKFIRWLDIRTVRRIKIYREKFLELELGVSTRTPGWTVRILLTESSDDRVVAKACAFHRAAWHEAEQPPADTEAVRREKGAGSFIEDGT